MADVAFFQCGNADFLGHAPDRFFKRQLHIITEIRTTAGALAPTAAEDIAEHIAKDIGEISPARSAAAAHAALFKRGMAVLVVGRALLRVIQDFIGFFGFFKLCFSFRIPWVAIRVEFHR
jgi:hypothetical protein